MSLFSLRLTRNGTPHHRTRCLCIPVRGTSFHRGLTRTSRGLPLFPQRLLDVPNRRQGLRLGRVSKHGYVTRGCDRGVYGSSVSRIRRPGVQGRFLQKWNGKVQLLFHDLNKIPIGPRVSTGRVLVYWQGVLTWPQILITVTMCHDVMKVVVLVVLFLFRVTHVATTQTLFTSSLL